MQTLDLILFLVELAMTIGLFVVAKTADRVKNTKWKLLYLIPFVFVMVVLALGGFEISMLPAYIAGGICIAGFFKEEVSVRRKVCMLAAALVFVSSATVDYNPGYREPDYVGEYKEAFHTLQKHYVLGEYKGIDWNRLYDKYLEQFKEVKRQHDPVLNVVVWRQFCNEFHDGHVTYMTKEDKVKAAAERIIGNDYGLSLVMLSDGNTVAVNVDEHSEVYQAGIRNGTVIKMWNQMELEQVFAQADMSVLASMPLQENEDFYRPIVAAGIGEEVNVITFLDESGNEQTVEAHSRGSYYDRFVDTIDVIDQGVQASNLAFEKVSEDTYVLRIKEMQYDTDSYANGDHSAMQKELRDKLNELKQDKVKHLIIDIRSNSGGSPQMVMAVAQLFAPAGEYSYAYEGVFDKGSASYEREDSGRYKVGEVLSFTGENVWENRKVTILVNAQSISAADHFTYIMKQLALPNVEIMGFHSTNASGQAVSSIPLTDGMITYSAIPTLEEKGEILIDPDESREGGIALDKEVSFDQEAVQVLFDEGKDYLLQQALNE